MDYQIDDDETVVFGILRAVSDFENCPIQSLPPLQETAPTEEINRLFDEQFESSPTLHFNYSNSYIKIWDGNISISSEPPGERS